MGESIKTCTRKNIPLYDRLFIQAPHTLHNMAYFLKAYESCGNGMVLVSSKAQVKLLIVMEY